VPVEVHDAHDQALVDALWSDPVDRPGFSPSSRGGNIMCFGPDVTQNFLRENGFTLVVRSHQVPENNDGFFSHHGNRLLTVFSASNYCGSTGNQGAVLIFREKMGHLSYDVSRHFAPDFSSGAFQIPMDPTPEYEKILNREEVSAVQRAMQRDPTNQRLHTDVLGQVARLVVEHKAALWAFFFRHDSQKSGFVGVNIWLQGCRATIGDLPWPMLQKLLAVEEQGTSGQVDYFAFLERFRVRLSGDEVTDQWTDTLLARIYQRLLQYDISLRDILAGFDRDGNGVVTISELREAFAELDVGITTRQATSLMRTISSHASSNSPSGHVGGGIDVNSFLSRFEMVFRPCAGQRDIPPWITTLLKQLGRLIYGGIPGEETPENRHPPEDRARQLFEAADRDGDGTLTYDEFATALSNLLRHAGKVMQVPNLSEVELLEAARWIDTNRGGSINYLEFLSGFTPNDVIAGNAFHVDLLEHICTIVWSHKPALLFACLRLDPQHTGEISRERLVEALRGLNFSLHSPLTDEQILMLVDHTRFDAKTGHVRYQRFLDSFQVFDTQSPARS
jgi:protein phosphatase